MASLRKFCPLCFVPQSRDFGVRARRGKSLFGKQAPWSKSDAKMPRTPNSETFREAALPATAGRQCKMP